MQPSLPMNTIREACRAAERALLAAPRDERAFDWALDALREHLGPDANLALFVQEHGRLWILSQRGYTTVPDGLALNAGIDGRAARSGNVELVVDVTQDPEYVGADDRVVSDLALPLGGSRPAAGVLDISTLGQTLAPESVALFDGLRTVLGERLEESRAAPPLGLSALARLFVHGNSLREVGAIAELAARSLGHLLELDSTQLYLGSPPELERVAFWRRADSGLRPLDSQVVRSLWETVDSETSISTLDLDAVTHPDMAAVAHRYMIWLPLRTSGAPIGVLVGCADRLEHLGHDRTQAATLLAAHAAASLDSAAALERERRAATTDPLTGLENRRGFDDRFDQELALAAAHHRQLSVVLFDCDNFKTINDRLGHDRGDEALRRVAEQLTRTMRTGDLAARLGGDEFAVLLPGTEPVGAHRTCERLRSAITGLAIPEIGAMEASFGAASYPDDGLTAAELLRAADQAMYVAKSAGRNRTQAFRHLRAVADGSRSCAGSIVESLIELAQSVDESYLADNGHSQLVGHCAAQIGRRLELSAAVVGRLRVAGQLHDIGKLALPGTILRKTGTLTDDEWTQMRTHPTVGAHMLEVTGDDELVQWVRHHHERLDGQGYPARLSAQAIPLGSRVLAVGDAFEAMTSARRYREALPVAAAMVELRRHAGTQFDPKVVEALARALASGDLGRWLPEAA
jgi:diguanylate cyclase (GGDEF)-like protein